jgi:oxygen-independent coproporphyrinogen-3 oxidase
VGGGTPSMVDPSALCAVLAHVPLVAGAEVTVECNPDDVTAELLATYLAGGVTRISLGVQSTVPHVLAALGRSHDPASVERAVGLVRAAGFATFNLDVIYGAAGESLDDWRRTLADVASLSPPHVSAYALTVEAGTPLADQADRHPDDDDQADKYLEIDATLSPRGLANYEISNWALPGHECRHNLLYWRQGNYEGFGCAAHSHRDGRRWWNVRTPDRYLEAVEAGRSPESSHEVLDDETRALEALQLSIRTRDGVPHGALPPEERDGLDGLVAERDGRTVLTEQGRLMTNAVSLRLRVPQI